MSKRKFYQIQMNDRTAEINIYGAITSWPWEEFGEVSARGIKQEIDEMDVDVINVYINSPGGEVGEALAIYSALKRNKAQIHTYCDGFACSAATIIFCAGDVRTMGAISLMMIHNCMSYAGYANSNELRKMAEDTDKINQSSIEAYKAVCNLDEDTIKSMMDAETWLTAQECLEYGFATEIADAENDAESYQQAGMQCIHDAILNGIGKPVGTVELTCDHEEISKIVKQSMEEVIKEMMEKQKEKGDPENLDGQKQTDEKTINQKAAAFFAKLIK